MAENKTIIRGGLVLECLFKDGFKGKTIDRIVFELDIPGETVYRILQSWKALGWVVEMPVAGSKAVNWKVSEKLVVIAESFERHALEQIHSIKNNFKDVTGRELGP